MYFGLRGPSLIPLSLSLSPLTGRLSHSLSAGTSFLLPVLAAGQARLRQAAMEPEWQQLEAFFFLCPSLLDGGMDAVKKTAASVGAVRCRTPPPPPPVLLSE